MNYFIKTTCFILAYTLGSIALADSTNGKDNSRPTICAPNNQIRESVRALDIESFLDLKKGKVEYKLAYPRNFFQWEDIEYPAEITPLILNATNIYPDEDMRLRKVDFLLKEFHEKSFQCSLYTSEVMTTSKNTNLANAKIKELTACRQKVTSDSETQIALQFDLKNSAIGTTKVRKFILCRINSNFLDAKDKTFLLKYIYNNGVCLPPYSSSSCQP